MNVKFLAISLAIAAAFLITFALVAKAHIEESIKAGVESELAQQAFARQNEAIKENTLHKERITQHNANFDERFSALSQKYSQIRAKNSSCEAKLATIEKKIKAFYESK